MSAVLTAIAVAVGAGLASTFFLTRFQLPRERRKAGSNLLASMEWGDFFHLVLAVLNTRGYERGFGGGGTDGEYLLQRRGQDWLLSSRHSRAYTPGSTTISEFASSMRGRGIEGGILAIPQRFPRAAFTVARAHGIELLDGAGMWDELQPLLSDAQHRAIDRPVHARLRWEYLLGWVLAVLLGSAVFLAIKPQAPAAPAAATAVTEVARPESRLPPLQPEAAPARTVAQRRQSIANRVALLPGVTSASWPAESTLLVVVDNQDFDPRTGICPLLERDPELAASRLQIKLPPGSRVPVRFLQCRAY